MNGSPPAPGDRRPASSTPVFHDESTSEVLATLEGQASWGSFHLAAVMFQRVAQLRGGARPRVDSAGHNIPRVAFLEVMAGAIPWVRR